MIRASWLFPGLVVTILGHCPLTDWHFRILEKPGKTDLPDSYIKYLADRLTGLNFNPSLVDKVTLYVFLGAFAISLFFNVKNYLTLRQRTK